MSSQKFPESCPMNGILSASPDISPHWNANKVLVGYCSSDGFMGDAGATPSTWSYPTCNPKYVTISNVNLTPNTSQLQC